MSPENAATLANALAHCPAFGIALSLNGETLRLKDDSSPFVCELSAPEHCVDYEVADCEHFVGMAFYQFVFSVLCPDDFIFVKFMPDVVWRRGPYEIQGAPLYSIGEGFELKLAMSIGGLTLGCSNSFHHRWPPRFELEAVVARLIDDAAMLLLFAANLEKKGIPYEKKSDFICVPNYYIKVTVANGRRLLSTLDAVEIENLAAGIKLVHDFEEDQATAALNEKMKNAPALIIDVDLI